MNERKTNNTNLPLALEPEDTIAALATPPGRGGVGIIRVSGPDVVAVARTIMCHLPRPRYATQAKFIDVDGALIDEGLAIYFPQPHSFTGEDVLELHGHGGAVVMDCLLKRVLQMGVRLANPGEFSRRAFLNNKIDLTQAEAIADLINATSIAAARSAVRSLQGEFSQKIQQLVDSLIHLRMMVEAAIDFPEEAIDFLAESNVMEALQNLIIKITAIEKTAKQGVLLQEGITVVIAGEPNVGKSSLLNQLSGYEAAIVSDLPGTTRDILRETIHIDGMPIQVIDTAGLRYSENAIEQEGIRRAKIQMQNADVLLLIIDATKDNYQQIQNQMIDETMRSIPLIILKNKIDITQEPAEKSMIGQHLQITISAKTGAGIAILKDHIKELMGFYPPEEGIFIARRRQVDALVRAKAHLETGHRQLKLHRAGELLAEDLRQAQQALTEITGGFTTDDLLGKIFSEFCVGK